MQPYSERCPKCGAQKQVTAHRKHVCVVCYILKRCDGTDNPSGCWIWGGAQRNGYGVVRSWRDRKSRIINAHRLIYAELVEPVPDAFSVLHWQDRCGQELCCNPDHLFMKIQPTFVHPAQDATQWR